MALGEIRPIVTSFTPAESFVLAAAAVGGLATAAYLDGKYQLGSELTSVVKARSVQRVYERRGMLGGIFLWRCASGNLMTVPSGPGTAAGHSKNCMIRQHATRNGC